MHSRIGDDLQANGVRKASVFSERIMLTYVLLRFSSSESVHESVNHLLFLRR